MNNFSYNMTERNGYVSSADYCINNLNIKPAAMQSSVIIVSLLLVVVVPP